MTLPGERNESKVNQLIVCRSGEEEHFRHYNHPLMQMQKICNHPYLFFDEYGIDENIVRCCGKLQMVDNLLKKFRLTDHRVLSL